MISITFVDLAKQEMKLWVFYFLDSFVELIQWFAPRNAKILSKDFERLNHCIETIGNKNWACRTQSSWCIGAEIQNAMLESRCSARQATDVSLLEKEWQCGNRVVSWSICYRHWETRLITSDGCKLNLMTGHRSHFRRSMNHWRSGLWVLPPSP